jgi:Cu(I)/Ag(I) efflux system membrane fusion protein
MIQFLGRQWRQEFRERHRRKLAIAHFCAVFALGLIAAWFLWGRDTTESSNATADTGTATAAAEGPSMWTCSMHPQIRQPNPGDCPICGMDLIPVAKTTGGLRTLTVSPEAKALMDVETAPVERRYVSHAIRMVGKVGYDETKFGYITAWVAGRLDRLYVDYAGVTVNEGDHMAYVFSEELYAAQEELIESLKYQQQRLDNNSQLTTSRIDLVESARQKLRLLGLIEAQIKQIEQQSQPSTHLTIYAPVSGIVIEKLKQEGERVALGDRIYTIADLSLVWVHLDAYETDLPWIRYGQDVTITTEAYPGEQFQGRIAFIQPVLNDKTRTVKVRVNVPNVDGKLKPEMFVHATVRPKVAAGGRVMDPALAGKWICPMHPEIVKDESGSCDICEMALVRAESLGYVAPETDERPPPLVIPHLAVLPTGTRAVVYVELPVVHSAAEPAFQTLSSVVQGGDLAEIRDAFSKYGRMLDRPYDQPGTRYARQLWSRFADRLGKYALAGQRAKTSSEAQRVFGQIESTMIEVREELAPQGQPTFEGREIVLGPRAGDFYLVRHGLEEGELVVRQGNFKIDSEVQIQAKPSMMTPEGGGGGGGHDHGNGGAKKMAGGEHAQHQQMLPSEFQQNIRGLYEAYRRVTEAVQMANLERITTAFDQFGGTLSQVDGNQLSGHSRMIWKELSMLLGNDAVEGRDAKQMDEADRVYLLLKSHMRRLRDQLSVSPQPPQRQVERIVVAPEFQAELAGIWKQYLSIQGALAEDNLQKAQQALAALRTSVETVDTASLSESAAQKLWSREETNLSRLLEKLAAAEDIKAMREHFRPLSQEVGVLARGFGFGDAGPIYKLHCPMAFEGQGAIWYQGNKDVRNPYYGATMLKCADRVEELRND